MIAQIKIYMSLINGEELAHGFTSEFIDMETIEAIAFTCVKRAGYTERDLDKYEVTYKVEW